MAKFQMNLPNELIKEVEKVYGNTEKIFGGMTKAGAEVTLSNVRANAPASWRGSNIMGNIGLTRTYKTPSDGGINTKVVISGYFINRNGKRTPAPLVANMFEYGSSKHTYPKQPFFRKSFRKSQIEAAMKKAQKELSGDLLDE